MNKSFRASKVDQVMDEGLITNMERRREYHFRFDMTNIMVRFIVEIMRIIEEELVVLPLQWILYIR
jgi:hypothetical protein